MSILESSIKSNKTHTFFVNIFHRYAWNTGKNHPRYHGGPAYYGDGWRKIAQSIRERDKVCQHCGKTPEENGRGLDIHHKIPVRISRDNSPSNLIALCRSCHQKTTRLEEYTYPINIGNHRKCSNCGTIFLPTKPRQKICSNECKHKRERQYERDRRFRDPEAYQVRLQCYKEWYQANKDYVIEAQRQYRQRRHT